MDAAHIDGGESPLGSGPLVVVVRHEALLADDCTAGDAADAAAAQSGCHMAAAEPGNRAADSGAAAGLNGACGGKGPG